MNLLDAYVTDVVAPPKYTTKSDCWEVKVKFNCFGILNETSLYFATEPEAKAVKKGYKFLT